MARVFTIDGQTVLAGPSWTVSDRINSRTTMSCEIVDLLELDQIDIGDSISISNDSAVIFSGLVKAIDKSEISPGVITYNVQSVDNSALADKVRIAKVYENISAGSIVSDLIAEKLSAEGVTAGTIQTGQTIVKAVFNYITVAEALNYIKDLTGLVWNIDKDKKLHFFDRATNRAPYTLSDSVQHAKFKHTSNMDNYRNTQYVRGGKTRTSTQNQERPTPKPDGESRNFVLRFPVAEKPTIEISLAGGAWTAVASDDIGVNGIDKDKNWYFSYDSQTITQDNTETVLGTTDAIRVTYTGLRNLLVKVDSIEEIQARQEAETGTSGIYEGLSVEESINDSNQAIQYGSGMLATYGQIKDTVSFDTNVDGLQAGQLLRVTKSLYGIDDDFLIESITIRPDGPATVRYSVSALDGAAVGGWETFFKRLAQSANKFVIAENEVIIILNTQIEKQGQQGEYWHNALDVQYPLDTLYPGDGFMPNVGYITGIVYPITTLYPATTMYPGFYITQEVFID